jgi:hypothetical protein
MLVRAHAGAATPGSNMALLGGQYSRTSATTPTHGRSASTQGAAAGPSQQQQPVLSPFATAAAALSTGIAPRHQRSHSHASVLAANFAAVPSEPPNGGHVPPLDLQLLPPSRQIVSRGASRTVSQSGFTPASSLPHPTPPSQMSPAIMRE